LGKKNFLHDEVQVLFSPGRKLAGSSKNSLIQIKSGLETNEERGEKGQNTLLLKLWTKEEKKSMDHIFFHILSNLCACNDCHEWLTSFLGLNVMDLNSDVF